MIKKITLMLTYIVAVKSSLQSTNSINSNAKIHATNKGAN